MTLIQKLGALPGLQELLLTTNGSQLTTYAEPLKKAGVNRINISIDSLQADRFQRISRVGKLDKVCRNRCGGCTRVRSHQAELSGHEGV